MYSYDSTKKLLFDKQKPIIRVNDDYISSNRRPKWCKEHNRKFIPQFSCLCNTLDCIRCPFFAYSEADKKDKRIMLRAWHKENLIGGNKNC
jgi:hypothetical protein